MLKRARQLVGDIRARGFAALEIAVDVAEAVGIPPRITALLHRGPARSSPDDLSEARAWHADVSDPAHGPVGPRPATDLEPEAAEPATEAAEAAALERAEVPDASAPAEPLDETVAEGTRQGAAEAEPQAHAAAEVATKASEPARIKTTRKTTRKKAPARQTNKKRAVSATQQLPTGVRPLNGETEIDGSIYLARIVWALGVSRLEGTAALRPADIARLVLARSAVSFEPPNIARYIRRSQPSCISVDRVEGGSSFFKLNAEGRRLFDAHFRG